MHATLFLCCKLRLSRHPAQSSTTPKVNLGTCCASLAFIATSTQAPIGTETMDKARMVDMVIEVLRVRRIAT
jgi:predicted protein tyrosine phosphatase